MDSIISHETDNDQSRSRFISKFFNGNLNLYRACDWSIRLLLEFCFSWFCIMIRTTVRKDILIFIFGLTFLVFYIYIKYIYISKYL